MFSRRYLGALVVLLLAAILVAGTLEARGSSRRRVNEHSRQGEKLLEAGKVLEAVAEFEKALECQPSNRRVSQALAEARDKAYGLYLEAGDKARGEKDYARAKSQYERAVLSKSTSVARMSLQQVERKMERLEEAFEDGLRLIGQGRRAAAIQTMARAAAQWPGNEMFEMKLQAIRRGASKHHADEAQQCLDSGDWRSAAAQAAEALECAPGDVRAKKLQQVAEARARAHEAFITATLAHEQGRLEAAATGYKTCVQLYPAYPDAQTRLSAVVEKVGKDTIAAAKVSAKQKNWRGASEAYETILALDPNNATYKKALAQARAEEAKSFLAKGDRLRKRGLPGKSLLYYLSVLARDPTASEARKTAGKLAAKIAKRVEKRVAVKELTDTSSFTTLPLTLTSELTSHLSRVAPRYVTIVKHFERPNYVVSGAVRTAEVKKDERVTMGSTSYRVETGRYENPHYQTALARVKECEQRLAGARQKAEEAREAAASRSRRDASKLVFAAGMLTSLEEGNLERAQRRLRGMDQYIVRTEYQPHRYPIKQVEKRARLAIELQLFDTGAGRAIDARKIDKQKSRSDRYVKDDPSKNVRGDPLNLPPDDTLIDDLVRDARYDLTKAVDGFLVKVRDGFREAGSRYEQGGKSDEAVEAYVNYLYALPSTQAADAKVLTYLSRVGDLPKASNLKELFNRHVLR